MTTVNLSIKKVPKDVVDTLKERASRNHRSLQGEILSILVEKGKPGTMTWDEVYDFTKRLGLSTPSESVRMIREDRDSR